MATGIRDKVAIVGMGCTRFGERWNDGAEDLMAEAYAEALAASGLATREIQAAWLATANEDLHVGRSGIPLATMLRLPRIPVTRVENSAPAAPRPCAARSTPWRRAPVTWRWRWGWRS